MQNVRDTAKEIRRTVIEMAHHSKGGHVGSALSCVDILAVLYWKILKLDPWQERDIFILSKAHAAMALYSTLAIKGIIDRTILDGYCQNNGTLPAHLDKLTAKGVEVSAGSLGHGFNIGLGIAYGFKNKKNNRKVYAVIGDGESQEGSIWEGALFASKLGIDNFTAIIDYNNLQGYGRPCEICSYEPVSEKWKAFGWHAIEVDGHDMGSLAGAFEEDHNGKPKVIIAHTIKGKGVSFMENQLIWHYYIVTDEHREKALSNIE
ncbi:MAG: transketolase [Nitrospirae bacterium]|nr:transketolase [Nitrospirota bacterium]